MMSSVFSYRNFILSSVKSEFRSKFAGSKLGTLWAFLHPLAQVAVYAFILSSIMSAKLPGVKSQYGYPIYLMSGMLFWSLFSEVFMRSVTLFVDNANMLKKISFPIVVLPAIVITSALLNSSILLMAIYSVLLILGHHLSLSILWLIPLSVLTVSLAVGIGLFLGILNLFIRDISHLVTIGMQFLFWFTPIVYTTSIIPKEYIRILSLSPLFHLVSAYQSIILYDKAPELTPLVPVLICSVLAPIAAYLLFRRARSDIADAL